MTTPLYLKWTKADRIPSYQGGAPIPRRRWTELVADPVLCKRGWHACRWEDAVHHISDELWICRLDGPIVTGGDKVAAGRLLLLDRVEAINERTLRLFAADCAEQVLPIFAKAYPNDDRPAKAIQAARDYAEGRIDRNAVAVAGDAAGDAARDAAGDAARAAGWAAAGDAARAWQTDRLLVHYAGLNPADYAHRAVTT